MSINDMRECISRMYPGSWPDRVANMKANQVQAIFYKNFHYDGSPKPKIPKAKNKDTIKNTQDQGTQLTIWDI